MRAPKNCFGVYASVNVFVNTRLSSKSVTPLSKSALAITNQNFEQYTLRIMRSIRNTAMLLVPLAVLAQDVKPTMIYSRDRIDAPLGGEAQVSDLRVLEDGEVVHREEGTKTIGDKPQRLSYEIRLSSDQMHHLREFLESHDIRSLPKKVSSKTRPIDFF
jgi:hypothetical protein